MVMWTCLSRLVDLVDTVMMGGPFEEQDESKSKKGDSRARFDELVPSCIRRFIWNTAPHKLIPLQFREWTDGAADKFSDYNIVHSMRKYDGWFVVLYVTTDRHVYWQTTSGFVNSRMNALMRDFIAWLQDLASRGIFPCLHALKIEFVIQDKDGVDHLQLVGKNFDKRLYDFKIVITDYFQAYTEEMEQRLMDSVNHQREHARVLKTAPLNPELWRREWNLNGNDIAQRMEAAKTLLLGRIPPILVNDVIFAEVTRREIKSSRLFIHQLAEELQASPHKEGFILHCCKGTSATYDIYKFKLEYIGGLSVYYSDKVDRDMSRAKLAGRQFIARLLTVERLQDSYIPYRIGIGYWDEGKGKWVVTDCLPLKYEHRIVNGLLPMEGGTEVSKKIKMNVNIMAKVLSDVKPTFSQDDLFLTEHYKQESNPNFLNVCDSGLIIAGSANAVYQSEQNNFHLQAAIIKHVGITQRGLRRLFTEFDSVVLERPISTVLPAGVSTEWTKEEWKRMETHDNFNKSDCLSRYVGGCVPLHTRMCEVNCLPLFDYVDRRPIEYKGGKFLTFMCLKYPSLNQFRVITQLVKGILFHDLSELLDSGCKLDVLVVGNTMSIDEYADLKSRIPDDFIVLGNNWMNNLSKGFQPIPEKYFYNPGMWCDKIDQCDHVNRFIMNRYNERQASGFQPSKQSYKPLPEESIPPLKRPREEEASSSACTQRDISKLLTNQTFHIILFADSEDVCINVILEARNRSYTRQIDSITETIKAMGGTVADTGTAKAVVLHLPTWDLPIAELYHANYFTDLQDDNSLSIDTHKFTKTGAGQYNDSQGQAAGRQWFQP